MTADWIAAEEARDRLGVRPQTLYAYVSRGRVQVRPDPGDPRRSLYRSADIAAHNGANFTAGWINLNNGLAITQFYSGAGKIYPGGVTRIIGGTQDNGSLKAPARN